MKELVRESDRVPIEPVPIKHESSDDEPIEQDLEEDPTAENMLPLDETAPNIPLIPIRTTSQTKPVFNIAVAKPRSFSHGAFKQMPQAASARSEVTPQTWFPPFAPVDKNGRQSAPVSPRYSPRGSVSKAMSKVLKNALRETVNKEEESETRDRKMNEWLMTETREECRYRPHSFGILAIFKEGMRRDFCFVCNIHFSMVRAQDRCTKLRLIDQRPHHAGFKLCPVYACVHLCMPCNQKTPNNGKEKLAICQSARDLFHPF